MKVRRLFTLFVDDDDAVFASTRRNFFDDDTIGFDFDDKSIFSRIVSYAGDDGEAASRGNRQRQHLPAAGTALTSTCNDDNDARPNNDDVSTSLCFKHDSV